MSESPSELPAPVPTKDLDEYIADPFNQNIDQDLAEFEFTSNQRVEFFHWFYRLAGLIEKGKPSAALEDLDASKCDGPLRLWIVYQLRNKFRDSLREAWPDAPPEELPTAFHVIDTEYERLERLYPPDMFASITHPGIHGNASSAVARGKMVSDGLVNMFKNMIREGEEKRAFENQIRQSEQERMREEVERIVHEVMKSVKQPKQNPEFTTNRQVIALGFMLRKLGVSNIDKKVQANFVEFLTGKNNKEIYDRVRELDETIYNKSGKDAEYVIDWFEKLGWNELANELRQLLGKKAEDL